jgi:putative transposase
MDMFAPVQGLRPQVTATPLRPLSQRAWAMLVLPGRGTRLGLSRWAGKGGRDRPIPRLCSHALPGAMRCWVFCRQPVPRPAAVYRLAGAAVVVTTAGQHPSCRFS